MKKSNLWHKLSSFFEDGDLTPLAVLISVAHYGPVLVEHGENVIVAWAVGALVDLLHFRTVRRLFQASGRRAVIGHAFIALLTTFMAAGYHYRFYNGDWLLALPIPIGIAVLAQHAASQKQGEIDGRMEELVRRIKNTIRLARYWQRQARESQEREGQLQFAIDTRQELGIKLQSENTELQAQNAKLQTDLQAEQKSRKQLEDGYGRLQNQVEQQQSILKAWQSMNQETQTLARFNANLITAEQAADIIGVKDVRTVQSRAQKLNGISE